MTIESLHLLRKRLDPASTRDYYRTCIFDQKFRKMYCLGSQRALLALDAP